MSKESKDLNYLVNRLSVHDPRPPTPPADPSSSLTIKNGDIPLQGRLTPPARIAQPGLSSGSLDVKMVFDSMSREVARILDRIYEIQELRHSASASSSTSPVPSSNVNSTSRIDSLLANLDSSVASLTPRIATLAIEIEQPDQAIRVDQEELLADWKRASEGYVTLKEELKEEGWLLRFRTTADQAEAMMDPLARSLQNLSLYVARIASSHIVVPFESELEDEPSIRHLHSLTMGHESMKGTYVPSINKILSMMGRSIVDRATRNGGALRRFGDMQNRWTHLQRQTQQLDARIRLIFSQYQASSMSPVGNMEELGPKISPFDQISSDYFGISTSAHGASKRTVGSHRSSVSSAISANVEKYRSPVDRQVSGTLSPEIAQRSLRRRPSALSARSASTARTDASRPPWNISTKPEKDMDTTPTHQRFTSYGSRYSQSGTISPTLSSPSAPGSVQSRPDAVGSRIPIISPKNKGIGPSETHKLIDIPALAVSTSHTLSFLSGPPPSRLASDYHIQSRSGPKTPEPGRSRPSVPMTQPRPSMTPTNRSFSSITTPRTAPPPRRSGIKAPPSSFRAKTPTPGTATNRPASRMSVASYSNFNVADVRLFQPSKYDLLDQHVEAIIQEVGFDLFVGRVDLPMRKGQRRRDDEEWKGELRL